MHTLCVWLSCKLTKEIIFPSVAHCVLPTLAYWKYLGIMVKKNKKAAWNSLQKKYTVLHYQYWWCYAVIIAPRCKFAGIMHSQNISLPFLCCFQIVSENCTKAHYNKELSKSKPDLSNEKCTLSIGVLFSNVASNGIKQSFRWHAWGYTFHVLFIYALIKVWWEPLAVWLTALLLRVEREDSVSVWVSAFNGHVSKVVSSMCHQ